MRQLDPEVALRRIGARIAELRAAREMTQEAMAELAKVSSRWIQMVESGEQNLTVKTMVRLANILRVNLADLVAAPTGGPSRVRARHARR